MSQTMPPLVVASDDALAGVLERLRQAGANGRKVDLVIPADSALLLTAAEFRALRDALDRDRLAVTLRTDDPLRMQLARLLGIPVEPPPPPRQAKSAAAGRMAKSAAARRAPAGAPGIVTAAENAPRAGTASDDRRPAPPPSTTPTAGPIRANRFAGRADPPAEAAAEAATATVVDAPRPPAATASEAGTTTESEES
ncbi:MAG TPA: hypothetical protein VFI22_06045, partial [Thermomicrobiales bacterium]|nr:hypothetical protein [Thermomicrobiales bacterium]